MIRRRNTSGVTTRTPDLDSVDSGIVDLHPETLAISLGRPPAVPDAPLNFPITPASALRPGGVLGYARDGHLPWTALEGAIGTLEGGHAVIFASGMAAATAVMGLFPPDPIVVAPGVAYMDVREGLGRLRGEVRWVDVTDTDAVLAACENANVLWLESPTNPLLGIADLPRLCGFARRRGIFCAVDNTFCTPLLQRPLALGADVVIHSATKAIGGHSDLLLGAAVTEDHHRLTRLQEIRARTGATPGALEVFLCLRGVRTLPLRLERAQHNATVLAQRLTEHPAVYDVRYPGLASHPQHERASAMAGPGFMLTFRVRGGAERADSLLNSLALLVHTTSLGGVETTIERRAKYPAERHTPGDLLRVSVGCEHVDDLWADLRQALERSESAPSKDHVPAGDVDEGGEPVP
jgi:cystathionine gamma-synthase